MCFNILCRWFYKMHSATRPDQTRTMIEIDYSDIINILIGNKFLLTLHQTSGSSHRFRHISHLASDLYLPVASYEQVLTRRMLKRTFRKNSFRFLNVGYNFTSYTILLNRISSWIQPGTMWWSELYRNRRQTKTFLHFQPCFDWRMKTLLPCCRKWEIVSNVCH